MSEETSQTVSETPSFYRIAEDFKDALNQVIEDCPYDDSVMENLNDLYELLVDVMANDL